MYSVQKTESFDIWFRKLGDLSAKARGMSLIAQKTGLGRESLYKALNPNANPRFDTILKVLNAINLHIKFEPLNN